MAVAKVDPCVSLVNTSSLHSRRFHITESKKKKKRSLLIISSELIIGKRFHRTVRDNCILGRRRWAARLCVSSVSTSHLFPRHNGGCSLRFAPACRWAASPSDRGRYRFENRRLPKQRAGRFQDKTHRKAWIYLANCIRQD